MEQHNRPLNKSISKPPGKLIIKGNAREMGTGTVSLHFLTFPQDAIDSICHQPGENRQFGPVLHLPPPAFRIGWVPMNYSKLLALFLFQNPKNMVK